MTFLGSALATYMYDRMNKLKEQECIRDGIDIRNKGEYAVNGCDSPFFRYVQSHRFCTTWTDRVELDTLCEARHFQRCLMRFDVM